LISEIFSCGLISELCKSFIIEKARFRNPVIPDCKLELNIEAIRSHGRVWKYKGEAFVDGKRMADAQWSATIVDRK
jgi:3-hydroxyacyl-[acyl-carrier-protein] dehydratase